MSDSKKCSCGANMLPVYSRSRSGPLRVKAWACTICQRVITVSHNCLAA